MREKTEKVELKDILSGLENLPPAKLLGVELLQKHKAPDGNWFPNADEVPRKQLVEAAKELVEYGTRCNRIATALGNLPASPSPHVVPEFGL